jgi:tripartite-type tricarboxylate transporter receptor subunit TctC
MKTTLKALSIALAGTVTAGAASAQDYPDGPVSIIVPAPAGGSTDVGTRILGEYLEEHLGQPITVVNRGGAATLIGTQALAEAEPDGYTLGYTLQPFVAVHIYVRDAPFDIDSFVPVALVVDDPNVVAVPTDAPWQTFNELVEDMKARPGEITWGDTGYLSDDHLATVAIQRELKVQPNAVHYDGSGELVPAVLGGHVDVYVGNIGDSKVPYEEGNFRILAVATEERVPDFPDTLTFRELGIDLVSSSSRGVSFPAGTPEEIADKMAEAIAKASEDPEYLAKLDQQGLTPRVITRDDYGKFLRQRMDFVHGLLEELGEL